MDEVVFGIGEAAIGIVVGVALIVLAMRLPMMRSIVVVSIVLAWFVLGVALPVVAAAFHLAGGAIVLAIMALVFSAVSAAAWFVFGWPLVRSTLEV